MRYPVAMLVLIPALAWAQQPEAPPEAAQPSVEVQPATSRWYEIYRNGDKVGYSHVAWAPSTWEGTKTVHDTTRVERRSTRNMSGVKNVFASSIKIELERAVDGTLYLERYEVHPNTVIRVRKGSGRWSPSCAGPAAATATAAGCSAARSSARS